MLSVPRVRTRFGSRSFAVAAPSHHLDYPSFIYSQFPFNMLFSSPPQNIFCTT